jgi:hypothetical protein
VGSWTLSSERLVGGGRGCRATTCLGRGDVPNDTEDVIRRRCQQVYRERHRADCSTSTAIGFVAVDAVGCASRRSAGGSSMALPSRLPKAAIGGGGTSGRRVRLVLVRDSARQPHANKTMDRPRHGRIPAWDPQRCFTASQLPRELDYGYVEDHPWRRKTADPLGRVL